MSSAEGIEVVLPRQGRRWMAVTIERLVAAGHDVSIRHVDTVPVWPAYFDHLLAIESRLLTRRRCNLANIAADIVERRGGSPALRVDLTGGASSDGLRTLTLTFAGRNSPAGILDELIAGGLPRVTVALDDVAVAEAAPMVDNRVSIAAGLEDVLARAITLTIATTGRVLAGEHLAAVEVSKSDRAQPATLGSHLSAIVSRVTREILRRRRYRFAHWRTGYRIAGDTWREVQDDGSRFFADPFPLLHRGRHYLFVEDFAHATGKAVISVSEIDASGEVSSPRKVLEEPTHLSYPQVFEHGGDVWMIPENSAAREVVLYRAERFPDRWVRHTTLIANAEISDATLLVRDGLYWLFGTLRDGYGSTSDTLVVYHAPALTGPWTSHAANPIYIDHTAARPAGAFLQRDERTFLPVQNGADGYGGGMGLSELLELTVDTVRLDAPTTFDASGTNHRVHTYNAVGGIEVIDWIVEMPISLAQPMVTAPSPRGTPSLTA